MHAWVRNLQINPYQASGDTYLFSQVENLLKSCKHLASGDLKKKKFSQHAVYSVHNGRHLSSKEHLLYVCPSSHLKELSNINGPGCLHIELVCHSPWKGKLFICNADVCPYCVAIRPHFVMAHGHILWVSEESMQVNQRFKYFIRGIIL